MAALSQTPTEMLRAAWTWWRDEMASMLPSSIAALRSRWTRTLLLDCDGASLYLSSTGGKDSDLLGSMPLPAEATESHAVALGDIVADQSGAYDRRVLRLAPDLALRRRLRLPLAARESLYEAVALDLDRQMPLPADALYFGVREVAINRTDGLVEVQLDAVRRSDAEPILKLLTTAGLSPDRLEITADGPDLLPPETSGNGARLRRRMTAMLGVLVVLLTLLAVWLPAQRLNDSLEIIRAESTDLRAEATRVAALRERMAAIETRQDALVARKQAAPLALDVITAATRAIDDNAFLLEMTIDGDRLTINGYARTASVVLSAIDSSPMFSDARFVSSVTQDAQLQRDRFTLSARITDDATVEAPVADGAGS